MFCPFNKPKREIHTRYKLRSQMLFFDLSIDPLARVVVLLLVPVVVIALGIILSYLFANLDQATVLVVAMAASYFVLALGFGAFHFIHTRPGLCLESSHWICDTLRIPITLMTWLDSCVFAKPMVCHMYGRCA